MGDLKLLDEHKVVCLIIVLTTLKGASPGGSVIKNPSAMQETQVQSLAWEDSLEKEMATNSSILAWEKHGQSSLAGYSLWVRKESDTTEPTGHARHSQEVTLTLTEIREIMQRSELQTARTTPVTKAPFQRVWSMSSTQVGGTKTKKNLNTLFHWFLFII